MMGKNPLSNYHNSGIFSYNKNDWKKANFINDLEEFNKVAKFCFSLGVVELTPHGHLSKERIPVNGAAWTVAEYGFKSTVEFICVYNGFLYRFVFKPTLETDAPEFSGIDAIKIMREECAEILKPFAVKTNAEVQEIKETIPKLWIKLTPYGRLLQGQEIQNVVHIDINSAFPAGVVATHPEFKEFFTKHYKLRHENPLHKAIMNYAIGASQSLKIRGNRYPQLSKDGISWTVNMLDDLTKRLIKAGYNVIGYNTDGIFYQRKLKQPLFTGTDEGIELGQWKTDHVFDKIRFKSAGSYEYVENGVYHPVVRGATRLERTKPRENWQWGDIFLAEEIKYIVANNQIGEIVYGKEEF